jgi:hypothetical protein
MLIKEASKKFTLIGQHDNKYVHKFPKNVKFSFLLAHRIFKFQELALNVLVHGFQ